MLKEIETSTNEKELEMFIKTEKDICEYLEHSKLITYEVVDNKLVIKTYSKTYTVEYNEKLEDELLEILEIKKETAKREYDMAREEQKIFRTGLLVGLSYAALTVVLSLQFVSILPLLFALPCIILVKVIQELSRLKEICNKAETEKNHWTIILENRQKDKEKRNEIAKDKKVSFNENAKVKNSELVEDLQEENTLENEQPAKRISLKK